MSVRLSVFTPVCLVEVHCLTSYYCYLIITLHVPIFVTFCITSWYTMVWDHPSLHYSNLVAQLVEHWTRHLWVRGSRNFVFDNLHSCVQLSLDSYFCAEAFSHLWCTMSIIMLIGGSKPRTHVKNRQRYTPLPLIYHKSLPHTVK